MRRPGAPNQIPAPYRPEVFWHGQGIAVRASVFPGVRSEPDVRLYAPGSAYESYRKDGRASGHLESSRGARAAHKKKPLDPRTNVKLVGGPYV